MSILQLTGVRQEVARVPQEVVKTSVGIDVQTGVCSRPLSYISVWCWSRPISNQCCAWTTVLVVLNGCKMPFGKNHQETLKKLKVYYLQDLEITWH